MLILPVIGGADKFYQPLEVAKTVGLGTNYSEYTLPLGGYISGTITKASPSGVWSDIDIQVYDDSMSQMAWGHAEDSDGGVTPTQFHQGLTMYGSKTGVANMQLSGTKTLRVGMVKMLYRWLSV